MKNTEAINQVATALVVASALAHNYAVCATNDPDNSLVWEYAADMARDWYDALDRILQDLEQSR